MSFFKTSDLEKVSTGERDFNRENDIDRLDKPYEVREQTESSELTREQRNEIQERSQWSDQVVDAIGSIEEFQIYERAGLVEVQVGEKNCLVRSDLNMDQKDGFGRTNKERMREGLAPLTTQGRPYELHHIGQHQESPLAELTMEEHRGKGNDSVLHIKVKESEIDREAFAMERAEHWKERAETEQDGQTAG